MICFLKIVLTQTQYLQGKTKRVIIFLLNRRLFALKCNKQNVFHHFWEERSWNFSEIKKTISFVAFNLKVLKAQNRYKIFLIKTARDEQVWRIVNQWIFYITINFKSAMLQINFFPQNSFVLKEIFFVSFQNKSILRKIKNVSSFVLRR